MATLTVADYIARMMHASKGAGTTDGVIMLDLLNEALTDLFNFHDWSWRKRPDTTLSFVADQSYVALPADFGEGELFSVHSNSSATLGVVKVSLAELAAMRSVGTWASSNYYVALAYPIQASASVAPGAARLEIWPTPTDSTADAIRVTYKAGPIELGKNSDVPNIPRSFQAALSSLARGKVREYERGDFSETNAGIARLQKLVENDGLREADVGRITGGAATLGRTISGMRPYNEEDIPDH